MDAERQIDLDDLVEEEPPTAGPWVPANVYIPYRGIDSMVRKDVKTGSPVCCVSWAGDGLVASWMALSMVEAIVVDTADAKGDAIAACDAYVRGEGWRLL